MFSLEITPTPEHKAGLLSQLPLTTGRLLIREFQLADARDLFALHRDALATRYAGGTRTKAQSFQSLCRIINRVRETGFGALAVQHRNDSKLIGWAGIQRITDSDRYEILYALNPTHWGNGLATEASRALLHSAFTLPSGALKEVFALVFPQNIGSICVLEKIGMEFLEYYFDQSTQRYACLYRISQSNFLSTAP